MFIAFEGLDGAGTTTHSNHLVKRLEDLGHSVLHTCEPTSDTPTGIKIREALQHKFEISPKDLQLLFTEDRAEHIKNTIEPALSNNIIVITDRYFFSTIAYGALNVDMEWLKKISSPFPIPDLTLMCECDVDICLKRIGGRDETPELFEKKDKLDKIAENYSQIMKEYPNVEIIDSGRGIPVVDEEIWKIVENKFKVRS